jgi:plastocyanin
MRPITWTVTLAAALALFTGGADAAPPPEARVSISQFRFQPAEISIAAGGTVTWVNGDAEEHTVTATDRSYTSPGLEEEETFSHRFTAPGTYRYFCALHPHMTATVVVVK